MKIVLFQLTSLNVVDFNAKHLSMSGVDSVSKNVVQENIISILAYDRSVKSTITTVY